jgi:predicted RNase H-like HicB family nuclease
LIHVEPFLFPLLSAGNPQSGRRWRAAPASTIIGYPISCEYGYSIVVLRCFSHSHASELCELFDNNARGTGLIGRCGKSGGTGIQLRDNGGGSGDRAALPHQGRMGREAEVWVASSDDVPGLATGADAFEELIAKLKVVIPELLEENGLLSPGTDEVPFAIFAKRVEHAQRAA